MARVPVALTIAGSDSGGGAGLQADLKTFSALGVYGASAVTAVTAQDTKRVYGVVEMEPAFVAQQIDAVIADIGVDAVKTGMLSSAAIVETVAERMRYWDVHNLIVDPVMIAKGGDKLLRDDAIAALIEKLLPLALVVTPNIPEAETLTGRKIESWEDTLDAARQIHALGAANVVIKGGHAESNIVTDVLFDGADFKPVSTTRVPTTSTHGTGCTFASAMTAMIAKGEPIETALAGAKAYVTKALQEAYPLGGGHGPVHHFYRYWRPPAERPSEVT